MRIRAGLFFLLLAIFVFGASDAGWAESPHLETAAAVQRLAAETNASARVEINPATGVARLVRLAPGSLSLASGSVGEKALDLFGRHGALFGIVDPARELKAGAVELDAIGMAHQSFEQYYRGVPVFAGLLRAHSDAAGRLVAVNGTFVPGIAPLSVEPEVASAEAEVTALAMAGKLLAPERCAALRVSSSTLLVYRSNLARGVAGRAHLVWGVAVANHDHVLERLYVDAHTGELVDRVSAVFEIHRLVSESTRGNILWREGDAQPYSGSGGSADDEINVLIDSSLETYELFANLSDGGYLSYDGDDATMLSVYRDSTLDCPNAHAVGDATGYCEGMVSDDVVAHEWVHNYTFATHGLIYEWQPGALNEAYSDIFGEVVDVLNGTGSDAPGAARQAGECSLVGGNIPPIFEVLTPSSLAGAYSAGGAVFNPPPPWSVSGTLELVDDGSALPTLACEALQGFTPGNVAVIDRGECFFIDKVAHAEAAGAIAVVIVNNAGDDVINMGGTGAPRGIPALMVGQSDGEAIKAELAGGVTASLSLTAANDPSLRWLVSEDSAALGAIRDMWNPVCFGDPGKVSDGAYHCGDDDNGGVHTNSGVPNHAFALIVDGGDYNGHTVAGLGFTKAAHIYWRAMTVYQGPVTGFASHADLIELSCQDLVGAVLTDLLSGAPSGEVINAADCGQVAAAMQAVEMRANPSQCAFETLLASDAPAIESSVELFADDFTDDPANSWTLSNEGTSSSYDPRDWQWTSAVPEGGDGAAVFATDRITEVGDCSSGDQSGVMHMDSPPVELPLDLTGAMLVFDHWVATESNYDGGNLKLSVNGGNFALVPYHAFHFNPYNSYLLPGGNTNPMAGEWAFSGANPGTGSGSWGQSQVDLMTVAEPGDTITVRFDFGVDYCNGVVGWYVDNVKVLGKAIGPRRGGGRLGN